MYRNIDDCAIDIVKICVVGICENVMIAAERSVNIYSIYVKLNNRNAKLAVPLKKNESLIAAVASNKLMLLSVRLTGSGFIQTQSFLNNVLLWQNY